MLKQFALAIRHLFFTFALGLPSGVLFFLQEPAVASNRKWYDTLTIIGFLSAILIACSLIGVKKAIAKLPVCKLWLLPIYSIGSGSLSVFVIYFAGPLSLGCCKTEFAWPISLVLLYAVSFLTIGCLRVQKAWKSVSLTPLFFTLTILQVCAVVSFIVNHRH